MVCLGFFFLFQRERKSTAFTTNPSMSSFKGYLSEVLTVFFSVASFICAAAIGEKDQREREGGQDALIQPEDVLKKAQPSGLL